MSDFSHNDVSNILAGNSFAPQRRREILDRLLSLYETDPGDEEQIQNLRHAFLRVLMQEEGLLNQPKYARFLAEHIEPEDLLLLEWNTPHRVVSFFEYLNSFEYRDETTTKAIRQHVKTVLRKSLKTYEQQGKLEKMFQLIHFLPVSWELMNDSELLRLRNRAYLYEMRRVRRGRRLLRGYLWVQAFLIFIVFPFLFINAENGRIQRQIEEMTEVDVSEPGERPQFLSYSDGLYWSLITAGSIGYGDVTPQTLVGRVIASFLGVMGVITIGVIAGLILDWLSPRI